MTSISKVIPSDVLFSADRADERSSHSASLQDCRNHIRQSMEACRKATLVLFQTVDYETFCQQAHPDFSPIGWHLGHIAYTEALWLLEHSAGLPPQFPEYRRIFAADSLPKAERVYLPDLAAVQTYLATVRTAAFAYLETAPLDEQERLWRWLLQHESQHGETIALVLELMKRQRAEGRGQKGGEAEEAAGAGEAEEAREAEGAGEKDTETPKLSSVAAQSATQISKRKISPTETLSAEHMLCERVSEMPFAKRFAEKVIQNSKLKTQNSKLFPPPLSPMICIPAGTFECGNNSIEALDNERSVHRVYLETFWLDRTPVTCEQYQTFMAAGGYQDSRWWSVEGWAWLQSAQVTQPLYWLDDGSEVPDRAQHPVCGVNWYEADAYARFVGKRLPTEAEWEKAASWNPIALQRQTYPWGELAPNANDCNGNCTIGQTTPVNAYPTGSSPYGCEDMLGNVWEWTASWFDRYVGFAAYPYRGYSEAYFDGQHRVLKGGSWATQPSSMRCAFRNWYHPHVREILAGFRCAADSPDITDQGVCRADV